MNADYEAYPKVIPAGRETEVCLKPTCGHPVFAPNRVFTARFCSKVNRADDAQVELRTGPDGAIRQPLRFMSPGEYLLEARTKNEKGEEKVLFTERFFATCPELAALRPYKGDVHIHTCGSDGRQTPATMALAARALGLDFAAITDHDTWEPAALAEREAARLGLPLVVIKGEEVTLRERGGHILSLGASGGVSKLGRTPAGEEERARIVAELAPRQLLTPLTADQYSHGVWTMRKIRELGGAALVAHPHWETSEGRYYPPRAMFQQLVQDGLCDGIELAGGSPTTEGNALALASYGDELARGRRLPITGGSDAHGYDELGRFWTLVFADGLDAPRVIRAIVELRSVACDQRVNGGGVFYGPFDFVEYASYLHREFYPLHDAICRLQAGLCARKLRGPAPETEPALEALARDLAELYARFWL